MKHVMLFLERWLPVSSCIDIYPCKFVCLQIVKSEYN